MITLSANQLIRLVGCAPDVAETFEDLINETCSIYQINSKRRLAAFLAQTGHESFNFKRLVESLDYAAENLVKVFGRSRITLAEAMRYGRLPLQPADQERIANIVYGGRWGRDNLGNKEVGDGWKYRGRGLIQTTGRWNYKILAVRLARFGVDFVEEPDRLAEPRWAAISAGDYWDRKGLNELADQDRFSEISRTVNSGMAGASDRLSRYRKIMLKLNQEFPS